VVVHLGKIQTSGVDQVFLVQQHYFIHRPVLRDIQELQVKARAQVDQVEVAVALRVRVKVQQVMDILLQAVLVLI
jgi:hypothetical protein